MKFVVDQTLAGLAKWLRLCGYDTVEQRISVHDPASWPTPLVATVILTRQQALVKRTGRSDILLVQKNIPAEQLTEVFTRLGLDLKDLLPLKRCSRCNQLLTPISKEAAWGRVPEYIYDNINHYYECPTCRRLFWPGSHQDNILAKIKEMGGRVRIKGEFNES